MASESKEDAVLKLILENSPFKEWHFTELMKSAHVTRAVAHKWLCKYVSQGLLCYVKNKGKFPYYTIGSNNALYYSLKRIYVLEQIQKSGLMQELLSQKLARTVILFGSTVRGDWYENSDVDIFIFGDVSDFDKNKYELLLGRKIELHLFQSKQDLKDVKTGLISNIVNGYILKGQIQDIVEIA